MDSLEIDAIRLPTVVEYHQLLNCHSTIFHHNHSGLSLNYFNVPLKVVARYNAGADQLTLLQLAGCSHSNDSTHHLISLYKRSALFSFVTMAIRYICILYVQYHVNLTTVIAVYLGMNTGVDGLICRDNMALSSWLLQEEF